jgi:ribosomal protein S18 acetylase RimI-like enzyme
LDQQVHREILSLIPSKRVFATLWESDTLVCCGLGVQEDDYFGLFNLVTAPAFRNMGHGTAFVLGLLDHARACGARWAYLQVMESNGPARHVYRKVGFTELYRYWYRSRD